MMGEVFWIGIAVLVVFLLFRNAHGIEVPRKRPNARPTSIYLMVSENDPKLVKVGYTSRLAKVRRGELNGKIDGKLKILFRVALPHGYHAEQEALEDLRSRRWQRGALSIGTEWFRLKDAAYHEDVKMIILDAARRVRRVAEARGSWPEGGSFEVFEAGVNRARIARNFNSAGISTADAAKLLRAVSDKELDEMIDKELKKGGRKSAKNNQ